MLRTHENRARERIYASHSCERMGFNERETTSWRLQNDGTQP